MVVFDFDGTLSPIVADPAAAVPRPGVVDHLAALATTYRQVGVISGRPVEFLAAVLPPSIFMSGLYGMEEWSDGRVVAAPEFRQWADTMAWAVDEVHATVESGGALAGVEVEDKGLSMTLHYRKHPHLEDAVLEVARRIAAERGLDVRPARMSVEVHPPVPTDKGDVVRQLVTRCAPVESVLYVGDDVGDLPAFDALAALGREGFDTVAVAVESTELDPRLRERADLVIAETEVADLLAELRTAG